jgi:hypothetical protein
MAGVVEEIAEYLRQPDGIAIQVERSIRERYLDGCCSRSSRGRLAPSACSMTDERPCAGQHPGAHSSGVAREGIATKHPRERIIRDSAVCRDEQSGLERGSGTYFEQVIQRLAPNGARDGPLQSHERDAGPSHGSSSHLETTAATANMKSKARKSRRVLMRARPATLGGPEGPQV